MTNKLVIVESPSKSKTIEQYLGEGYVVKSSKGHVRDLAIAGAGGLGIDVANDFKPQYEIIPEKKPVAKELNDAAKKAKEIYLATDPDREGEAISWHLNQILDTKGKLVKRVIFNEITKTAILEAFQNPKDIDENLVSSQETRRILDRIIGFKLSKLLQMKIKSKSAGRVQSATLKLIVDREKEIEAFVPEEYHEIYAKFPTFEAQLAKFRDKTPKIASKEAADEVIASLGKDFTVLSLDAKSKPVDSKPPFITSTLQQDASNRLGFSPTKTMSVAQQLYEGVTIGEETVGLISYMRTDSFRLSAYFTDKAADFILKEYGKSYLGTTKKAVKGQNVQDAHEAIRPTDPFRTPELVKAHLTRDQFALYGMIWARALASLMKPMILEVRTLSLENGPALFRASSSKQTFDGYLRAYGKYETEESNGKNVLPEWTAGTVVPADSVSGKQCFTQAPQRYNEARLIKEMEDLGIGRPSTYATTVATLRERKYVTMQEKKFVPTEQGRLTIEKLDAYFREFVSSGFSKNMETVLDRIAEGGEFQVATIRKFWDYFTPLVDYATKNMERIQPQTTGEICPVCGSPMVHRTGRFGDFEACSNYPKCKYVKPDGKPKKVSVPAKDTGVLCPKCHKGHLVERIATKGKSKGKPFYACNDFPRCKFIAPFQSAGASCPSCGKPLVVQEGSVFCIDAEKCGYRE